MVLPSINSQIDHVNTHTGVESLTHLLVSDCALSTVMAHKSYACVFLKRLTVLNYETCYTVRECFMCYCAVGYMSRISTRLVEKSVSHSSPVCYLTLSK